MNSIHYAALFIGYNYYSNITITTSLILASFYISPETNCIGLIVGFSESTCYINISNLVANISIPATLYYGVIVGQIDGNLYYNVSNFTMNISL